jgi:cytochrome oxidase assembly protein ShyY1
LRNDQPRSNCPRFPFSHRVSESKRERTPFQAKFLINVIVTFDRLIEAEKQGSLNFRQLELKGSWDHSHEMFVVGFIHDVFSCLLIALLVLHEQLLNAQGPRSRPSTISARDNAHSPSGFHLITPFRLTDGREVIVNRGWIPESAQNPNQRPHTQV